MNSAFNEGRNMPLKKVEHQESHLQGPNETRQKTKNKTIGPYGIKKLSITLYQTSL